MTSPQVSLINALPTELILAVLHKMDLRTKFKLCEASSKVNAVMENYSRTIAKKGRETIGLAVEIGIHRGDVVLESFVNFDGHVVKLYQHPLKHIAAVKIEKLSIKFLSYLYKDEMLSEVLATPAELQDLLRQLVMPSAMVKFSGVTFEFIRDILSIVPQPKHINVLTNDDEKGWKFPHEEFGELTVVKRADEVKMKMAGMRTTGAYDKLAYATHTKFYLSNGETVRDFVRSICDAPLSNLRTVEFRLLHDEDAEEDIFDQRENLPRMRSFTDLPRYNDSPLLRPTAIQSYISLFNCPKKWIVVSENDCVVMKICEKNPRALLETLVDITFDPKKVTVNVEKYLKDFTEARGIVGKERVYTQLCMNVMYGIELEYSLNMNYS